MSLEKIKPNSLADPDVVNNNFEYLEDKITDTANKIYTNNANFESKISTLSNSIRADLEKIYPVGSIYIGVMDTCPIAALFGTWEKVSSGRVLQGADSSHTAGSTISAGLPNITGSIAASGFDISQAWPDTSGAFTATIQTAWGNGHDRPLYGGGATYNFSASRSNSIYGKSSTVQPPAFVVNIWKRTK